MHTYMQACQRIFAAAGTGRAASRNEDSRRAANEDSRRAANEDSRRAANEGGVAHAHGTCEGRGSDCPVRG